MWISVTILLLALSSEFVEPFIGFPLITDPKNIWDELRLVSKAPKPQPRVFLGAECDRPCLADEPPRVCYYHWTLENFASLGAACQDCVRGNREHCRHAQCVTGSGLERAMLAINRQFPGPPIVVCRNDTIVVDIVNDMEGLSTAIHWHGFHQLDSPWMDGVPMVTQCPIPPGTEFRYMFQAVDPGTQWYHSHAGFQKANGHIGVAVVRNPSDVNRNLYDYDLADHVMLLSDWTTQTVDNWIPGVQSTEMRLDTILVNGRGRHFYKETGKWETNVPLAVFRVQPNKRYRFRLISGGSQYCPFQLQIEKHRMTIISTDGGAVKPQVVDTLISVSGERYDFVLTADQKPGNYWIRIRGIAFCKQNPVEGFAVLSYVDPAVVSTEDLSYPTRDPPQFEDTFPLGVTLNHHTAPCYVAGDDFICAADLESHEVHRDNELIDSEPDQHLYIGFEIIHANNSWIFSGNKFTHFTNVRDTFTVFGVTNNISQVSPNFPLLTQPELITNEDNQFCNDTHRPKECADTPYCFCTHRLKVNLNDIVDITVYDTAAIAQDFYHPYHIHGHRFIIADMGLLYGVGHQQRVEYLRQRKHSRKPSGLNPPYKDTISIPNQGFVRTRFRANNPGFWLIHCHFEWHLGTGMGLVLQVGELNQMAKAPADFPRCGNFKPGFKN